MSQKSIRRIGLFAGLLLLLAALLPTKALAQETGLPPAVDCANGAPSYTALYQMPADTYDVYVRLGQQTQTAASALYFQSFSETSCTKIGSAQTSGQKWTKLGSIRSPGQDGFGTFTFTSDAVNALSGANRPTVMLVSQTDPACQPTTECFVNVNGQQMALRATGTLLSEDSLRVVTAKNPAQDSIKKVSYYIDNRLAYSSSDLEVFDMRYVSAGKHTLSTVVDFTSKQQAVTQTDVDRPYYDDLTYYAFTFIHQQRSILIFAGIILLVVLTLEAILLIRNYFHRRRVWLEAHFAKPVSAKKTATPPKLHIIHPDNAKITAKRFGYLTGLVVSSVLIVAVLNAWVVQLYQVDGPSMQTTLYTGDTLLVNKLPKTFSQLTQREYVPKRGQVIIFTKERNVLFEPVEADAPTYIVKRVIGLPGDLVVINGSTIKVYTKDKPNGFNPDTDQHWTESIQPGMYDQVTITLQPDEIFVVGDNRPESIDSRTYGAVKLDELVGQAVLHVAQPGQQKRL